MKKKLPPYARRTVVHDDNRYLHIHVGWISWERANPISQTRGMIYPPDTDPSLFLWPVNGCGVLIHDWHGLAEKEVDRLKSELKSSGASEAHYVVFP